MRHLKTARTWIPLLVLISISLMVAFVHPAQAAQPPYPDWIPIDVGIEFRSFQLPGPVKAYVARMDRHNPHVILESSIAQGRLSGGLEPVSGMFQRYDQAINFWGDPTAPPSSSWGSRNRVVVAINGYYYDWSTGVPQRGQVHSGWYAKRFDDNENGSGFAWKMNRQAYIFECVEHVNTEAIPKQVIIKPATGETLRFQAINVPRNEDELILYTPQFGDNTYTDDSGMEVLVELDSPALIFPAPRYITGYVRQIRKRHGSTPIPFDHIVLSAHGNARRDLRDLKLRIGDEIGISQEIRSYENDCKTRSPIDWTKTYASIGGDFYFLKNGEIQGFPDNRGATSRHPRTAIAYNDDYVFFIVVDGRDPEFTIGMTIQELAVFAREILGATWGIAQDGGGSSTMVVKGSVVNNTFCNNIPCRSRVYNPILTVPGPGAPGSASNPSETAPAPSPSTYENRESGNPGDNSRQPLPFSSNTFERWVANGMLMVVVEPLVRSSAFNVGEVVTTTMETGLYLGPGSNYGTLTDLPPYSEGQILDHFNKLNGVFAKGAYWWKVAFGEETGWVPENAITRDPLPPPPLPQTAANQSSSQTNEDARNTWVSRLTHAEKLLLLNIR